MFAAQNCDRNRRTPRDGSTRSSDTATGTGVGENGNASVRITSIVVHKARASAAKAA